jgi:hypothetical protein
MQFASLISRLEYRLEYCLEYRLEYRLERQTLIRRAALNKVHCLMNRSGFGRH